MSSRLHPRLGVGILLASVLTGCSSDDASQQVNASAAVALPDAPRIGVPDAISRVDGAIPVDTGPNGRADAIAVDRDGEPVVLVVDERGELRVVRPQQSTWNDRTWTTRSLDPLSGRPGVTTIAVTRSGDVFVAGLDGSRLAVAWVRQVGAVEITPVSEELDLTQATDVTTALAPDGDVLYVAYLDSTRTPQLRSIDPRTGALLEQVALGSENTDQVTPTEIAVSPSGNRVFVALEVEPGEDSGRTTATLLRLSDDLEPLGEVPLVSGGVLSRTAQLVAGRDGGAYATLVVGEAGTPDVEVQMVAVPPGAVAATPVARFPGQDDVQVMAVDAAREWAYLGGLASSPDPLTLTVTPVDLRTGDTRMPVQICTRGELSDLVLGGRDQAWVAGRCLDTGFASELWMLR